VYSLRKGTSLAEKTDSELVALSRNGDKDAFGLLAQRYQVIARRFAMRLVADDDAAQELAQEAMLQAYLSLDHLRDPARFKSWLYGIMLNVYRSRLRDRKIAFFSLEAIMHGLQFFPAPFSTPVLTPEKLAEEREQYQTVLNAVNTLSPGDRDILLLFYYAQLSLPEIVAMMNIPAGTVKVRLHRARQRLKTVLEDRYPDIIPQEKRRKNMVKVTIADVIKVEQKEGQELPITPYSTTPYVIVLYDEAGRRLMPIWIGPHEGQCIAMGLSDFATPRPLTYNFFSSLLQGINARLEEVRIVALKKDTYYAVVKMRYGKKTGEVDARPSDAIALAVLNNVPIFVAEEVLEAAGIKIPETIKGPPNRKGLEKIISSIREWQRKSETEMRQRMKQHHEMSQEDRARRNEEFIASIFGK
jgi:RNA polymerase sigma factor (sigma-70 family)